MCGGMYRSCAFLNVSAVFAVGTLSINRVYSKQFEAELKTKIYISGHACIIY